MIFSPFGWTAPSWKINRISRCFRLILVLLHNATPRTWTSEILWRVELKCWGTGNQGVLLHVLLRCSLKHFAITCALAPIICMSQWFCLVLANGFFAHWRRVINPKRFCFFFFNIWHFLFFFFFLNITLSTFGAQVSRIPDGFSANNVWSVCELVLNIVFESCRVARTYVGFFDWLVCWLVCD